MADIRSFPIPRFSEHRNLLRAELLILRWEPPLENRAEIARANGGMKTGINGGNSQSFFGNGHVALRTFLRQGTLNTVSDLTTREIGLKVLAGEGASIDTTTPNGRLVFTIFAGLAEFERELIVERTKAGLAAARARGRKGGRPFKMTPAKLRLAQAAMGKPETVVADLCTEIGVTRQTLYRFVDPAGQLRADGERLLDRGRQLR